MPPGPESADAAGSAHLASIAELARALAEGRLTSVALVELYLDRIARLDRGPGGLNSVPVLNDAALDEARRADRERREGRAVGPLHGLPFVVKDSFAVAGLTLAAGSPAFADLRAREDASTVALLREAGAIVIGKTTMPPMAAGLCAFGLAEETLSSGRSPASTIPAMVTGEIRVPAKVGCPLNRPGLITMSEKSLSAGSSAMI